MFQYIICFSSRIFMNLYIKTVYMFQYIICFSSRQQQQWLHFWHLCFNTLYVLVQGYKLEKILFVLYGFNTLYVLVQDYFYILHFFANLCFNTLYVLVQVFFVFGNNVFSMFQYIICFSSSLLCLSLSFNTSCFNTLYVLVQVYKFHFVLHILLVSIHYMF